MREQAGEGVGHSYARCAGCVWDAAFTPQACALGLTSDARCAGWRRDATFLPQACAMGLSSNGPLRGLD